MTESKNSNTPKFLCLIPSILGVLFAGLYALGVFPILSLVFVNILCIPLALLEMTLGFVDGMNRRKAAYFASSTIICALALLVNIQIDGEYVTLLDLPLWAKAWLIVLGISLLAFLVILIRLFRWTQEDWERAKSISQGHRLRKKQEQAQRYLVKRGHRTELSDRKHAYRSESAEQRYAHKREVQTAREKHSRERQDENYRESRSVWSKIRCFISNVPEWCWNLLKIAVFIIIIVLFFAIPVWQSKLPAMEDWATNVRKLMHALLGDRASNETSAVLYYVVLYVLIISLFGGVIFIIFRTVGSGSGKEESLGRALSDKYGTPIAVLIVAGMMLTLILGGTDLFSGISNIWAMLFMVIIFILLCLTAVELVRLTLTQCLQSDSLLNKLLRLVFVVTLDFLTDLILSVITRFRIQSLISSLLDLVFPEQNEELQKRIDIIAKKLLFKELDNITDDLTSDPTTPNGGFKKFWRKRTWRRRK